MLLKDKIAVIAGNAYGIGHETARVFTEQGARVFCVDDDAGREGATRIRIQDVEAPYRHADVSDAEQVRELVRECEQTLGKVDILFNVAGRALKQSFAETTEAAWAQMLGRNLTACFLCAKHFLPLMQRAGSGSIINHASIDSLFGNPSVAAYSAAKGGVIPLTHVMAHDLAKYDIRVNCISTGGIRSRATASSETDASRLAVTPSQRMGTPADVARVALFLACDWSSYVNGANLVVDGGRTAITQGCYSG